MTPMKHNPSPNGQPWTRYRTSAVRDLVWTCCSPALMDSGIDGYGRLDDCLTSGASDWFAQLDRQPDELLDYLAAAKSQRLGLYFEQLLAFVFSAGYRAAATPYRLITRNLPIRRGGETLGELDFVLEDGAKRSLHLEVAVKFYLGRADVPSTDLADWRHWLGPNAKDRLNTKLERMLSHQLAIAQTAQAALALQPHMGTEPITSGYFLRGILFYPYSTAGIDKTYPLQADSGHQKGYWVPQSQLPAAMGEFDADVWLPLERKEWLSGACVHQHSERRLGPRALEAYVAKELPRAQMVQGVNASDSELVRLIVVPDYWPLTGSPSRKI